MKPIHKISQISFLLFILLAGCTNQASIPTVPVATPTALPATPTTTAISETSTPSQEPDPTVTSGNEFQITAFSSCKTQCWPIAWLATDEIAYFSAQEREIKIASRQGEQRLSLALTPLSNVFGSPDGKWLAVSTLIDGGISELRIGQKDSFDLNAAPIFSRPAQFDDIRWTADSQAIFIIIEDANGNEVVKINPAGAVLESLGKLPPEAIDPALSPDARQVAYAQIGGNKPGIYLFDLASATSAILYQGRFATPSWSPERHQLAFVGDVSTGQPTGGMPRTKIYIATLGEDGLRLLESAEKSYRAPFWSPDGNCLVFAANTYNVDGSYVPDDQVYQACNLDNLPK